jgi:hypothetical protein
MPPNPEINDLKITENIKGSLITSIPEFKEILLAHKKLFHTIYIS